MALDPSSRSICNRSFLESVITIKSAANRSKPSRAAYRNSAVLALDWQYGGGIEPGPLEGDFLRLLTSQFGLQTIHAYISPCFETTARKQITYALEYFLSRFDCEDDLLAIYYRGQAMIMDGELIIFPGSSLYTQPMVVQLSWRFITSQLKTLGNILFILDPIFSCDRGDVLNGEIAHALQPFDKAEYLATSGHPSALIGPSSSLTQRLTDILRTSKDYQFTIAQLYAALCKQAPDQQIHIPHAFKPSVTLRVPGPTPRGGPWIPTIMGMDHEVLISVRLKGPAQSPELWKAILAKEIPDGVSKVSLEAVFDSESPLCLFKVQYATWTMLKRTHGYNFFCLVTSGNLMLEPVGLGGMILPRRPRREVDS